MYAFFDKSFFDIHAKAPAEVTQPFHYNPPHADTLLPVRSGSLSFQVCTTPSEPRKSTSGEKTASPFLPLPTKNLNISVFLSIISTPY